jgi:hypothetical protein
MRRGRGCDRERDSEGKDQAAQSQQDRPSADVAQILVSVADPRFNLVATISFGAIVISGTPLASGRAVGPCVDACAETE